jgi:multidrug resistance efflux pump
VIARSLNVGQVVAAGHELFVVTDLSTVWVIGDLYEKDFAAVRVGTSAAVRVPTSEASAIRGRVAYIDPRVDRRRERRRCVSRCRTAASCGSACSQKSR